MTMILYDEATLVQGIGRLRHNSQVAFAAACAERLFPAYSYFCQRNGRADQDALAGIVERVWQHLLGDRMTNAQLLANLQQCTELIPGGELEPWVDEQAYAEDAVSAIAYTLRALESGDPREAAWAARRAYEAADHHVIHRLGIQEESQVLAHPIVQVELSRQRRDLEELLGDAQGSTGRFIQIRDRARSEAPTFFLSTL